MRILLAIACLVLATPAAADPLTLGQYLSGMKPAPADETISYGPTASQVIDVYRPKTPGPHPVLIMVHGGCWSKEVGRQQLAGPAAALAAKGMIVWNIEYRRFEEPGGGYPGMYQDVAAAADRLRAEAPRLGADLGRVMAFGHSAGAHLALWAADRHKLPAGSALHTDNPLPIRTVVAYGGAGDLKNLQDLLPWACGPEPKIAAVVGPKTAERPDPFADTSPRALLPSGVRTVVLQGEYDDILPPFVALWWRQAATKAGDPVEARILRDAAHFDGVALQSPAWTEVQATIVREMKALAPAK